MRVTGPDSKFLPRTDAAPWELPIGGSAVYFGAGTRQRLAGIVERLGARRPLLVTDPGVRVTGVPDALVETLRGRGMQPMVFDQVCENPTTTVVEAGCEAAARHQVDLLVGVGGGSSLDAAKGINFLFSNGGRMQDYWGDAKATRPMLASVGVPTTAGTGSEAQRFALISRADDGQKMACGDPKARFKAVILDPDLTATVPQPVRATTGIDAVTHAVESHVSTRANRISRLYSREAWTLLAHAFADSIGESAPMENRADMLLGAFLAGAAIECSMLGAAHAGANPLTTWFGITHGAAVGLLLPHVIRYNRVEARELYAELEAIGRSPLEDQVEGMLATAGLPVTLRDYGVQRTDLARLAAAAVAEWTLSFNPRRVTESDMRRIYEAAY